MNNRKKVYHLIILDESGSMSSIREMILRALNEVIISTREAATGFPEQEHFVTFVTFNSNGIKSLLNAAPLGNLDIVSGSNYRPDASTPLYDAIGTCVAGLETLVRHESDCNVLVNIFTDGMENASVRYSGRDILALINRLKETGKWTFTYTGAEHDVEKAASSMAIPNVARFQKDVHGMHELLQREKQAKSALFSKIRNKQNTWDDYFGKQDT